jgi:preprotein translocase SecE subunit
MILGVYKRGQGKYTRLGTAGGGAVITAIGCWQLYRTLEAADLGLWVVTMVPAAMFVAVSALMLWLVNKSNVADFMIAAEGEMKKVNWSTRQEIVVSTVVVIAVVVTLAVMLGLADFILQLSIAWLL